MWYVVQVEACHELDMVNKCRKILREGEDVFTFLTERMERRSGEWKAYQHITFQKYIFIDTDDPDDLRIRLRSVEGLTRMLGVGDAVVPIRKEEEEFLKLVGGEDHIIGGLEISNEGDKIKIASGPLSGKEGLIKWIDKRQMVVGITVDFLNQENVIKLGAEFVRKD